MFEEEILVAATLDEQETVLQQLVHLAKILAEERTARFPEHVFLGLAPDVANRLANLAENILAVGLNLGNFRAHHVSLLAVLEMLPA